jgi:hypothetical protein
MRRVVLAVVLLLVVAGTIAWHRQGSSDLERYLDERRAAGMSEGAENALRSIAAIHAKSTVITFEREADGRYSRSYISAFCARPGMDPKQIAALQESSRKMIAAELKTLKGIADTDGSGFVSTAEGSRLQQLIEFATEATFIAEREGRDPQRVALAMGMPLAKFDQNLSDYRTLLHRNAGRNPRLKKIPL